VEEEEVKLANAEILGKSKAVFKLTDCFAQHCEKNPRSPAILLSDKRHNLDRRWQNPIF